MTSEGARGPLDVPAGEILDGDQIRLRPVAHRDLSQLREWYNRPDIFRYMGRDLPLTDADQERWFENLRENRGTRVYVVEQQSADTLLGSITLRNLDDPTGRGELGIMMGYGGSGHGSDAIRTLLCFAFQRLTLNCVSLEVRGDNRRAITAYMRAGFRRGHFAPAPAQIRRAARSLLNEHPARRVSGGSSVCR